MPAEEQVESDAESVAEAGLQCLTCLQFFGAVDIHSLKKARIKWGKYNKLVSGRKKATKSECYPCLAHRKKHRQTRKEGLESQETVVADLQDEKGEKDEVKFAKYMAERKAWMQGKGWMKKDEANASEYQVKSKHSSFDQDYERGHFYEMPDYLEMLEPEKDHAGWSLREVYGYLKKAYPHVKIVKDKYGCYGIREKMLPKGAKYEYKIGGGQENEFAEVHTWNDGHEDNKLDAAEAFDELNAADAAAAADLAEEDLHEGDLGTEDELFQDDDEPDGAVTSPVTPLPPRSAKEEEVKTPGALQQQRLRLMHNWAPMAKATVLSPRKPISSAASEASSSAAVQVAQCRSSAASEAGTAGAGDASAAATAATAPADDKKSQSQIAARLRSTCPKKVMGAAQALLAQSHTSQSMQAFWTEKRTSRDLKARVDALKSASARVVRLAPSGDADPFALASPDPTQVLALKLNAEADRLKDGGGFILAVKKDPLSLLSHAVSDKLWSIIKHLAPRLATTIFTAVATGAVSRLALAPCMSSEPQSHEIQAFIDQAKRIVNFGCCWLDKDSELHLGMVPGASTNGQNMIQERLVTDFANVMFKGSTRCFTITMRELQNAGLVPTHHSNFFVGPSSTDVTRRWSDQSYIDWSALSLMARAIETVGGGIVASFASAIVALSEGKESISLGLKVFSGKKNAVNGDADVGRWAWQAIEKIIDLGQDSDSLIQAAKIGWSEAKGLCPNITEDASLEMYSGKTRPPKV